MCPWSARATAGCASTSRTWEPGSWSRAGRRSSARGETPSPVRTSRAASRAAAASRRASCASPARAARRSCGTEARPAAWCATGRSTCRSCAPGAGGRKALEADRKERAAVGLSKTTARFGGVELPVYSGNTLVIGSGAAGLCAALELHRRGLRDLALVTERWGAGTSANAGSDKQTYYKLSLAAGREDSPLRMARDLFAGGCVHGDIALVEALCSPAAFFNLVSLGVPFPHERHGGFPGYRTDHDASARATSAGPLTSRQMCGCLGREVHVRGIEVFDCHQVVALLTRDDAGGRSACGAIVLNREALGGPSFGFEVFNATNVVLATGGPGGLYAASVYPGSQICSLGLGLEIGAVANNLTEMQFGLASIGLRWNMSGSYQQVIPRYVSTGAEGGEERDFLCECFPDMATLANAIFRKGYQWPFDADKIAGFGSSLIDLLVYRETGERGRRVFLDFTANPAGKEGWAAFSLDLLDAEAAAYLARSRATQARPIERLLAMNPAAVDLFRGKGIDLERERLEIAVCAQHMNGGLRGDVWWQSSVGRLFPVGEVNGTHGVKRPGGAALNAGQVGAARAAEYIARRCPEPAPPLQEFLEWSAPRVERCLEFARRVTRAGSGAEPTPNEVIAEIQARMSEVAAIARGPARVAAALTGAERLWDKLAADMRVSGPHALLAAFIARDLCLTHRVVLFAIKDFLEHGGGSRGSSLVLAPQGARPCAGFGDEWRFQPSAADAFVQQKIQEVFLDEGMEPHARWVDIRPIPCCDEWFETVWDAYSRDQVVW
ncbi:MAG: FAD-binding protein [Planctomycetes bacterium]|nr:FAD-binding protein [Planctomycetota bacterium]